MQAIKKIINRLDQALVTVETLSNIRNDLHSSLRSIEQSLILSDYKIDRGYIPNYFIIQELIPNDVYDKFQDFSWMFLDSRLVWTLDALRRRWGEPITVNDWHWGGDYTQSGYRPPESLVGAPQSQHRFGRAADLKINGIDYHEAVRDIQAASDENWTRYITRVENPDYTPTWLHIETSNTATQNIIIFNP